MPYRDPVARQGQERPGHDLRDSAAASSALRTEAPAAASAPVLGTREHVRAAHRRGGEQWPGREDDARQLPHPTSTTARVRAPGARATPSLVVAALVVTMLVPPESAPRPAGPAVAPSMTGPSPSGERSRGSGPCIEIRATVPGLRTARGQTWRTSISSTTIRAADGQPLVNP